MSLDLISIIDTETQGLDPAVHRVLEVACILWSVRSSCVVEQWSTLIVEESNDAAAINKIPVDAMRAHGVSREVAFNTLGAMVERSSAWCAHRIAFDAAFLPDLRRPSFCTKFDVAWPLSKLGDSLVQVAVSHGVPVTAAHRALTDCQLLARTFERCAELGHDVDKMIAKALRPRAVYQACVSYDDREKAKAAGFGWDGASKRWTKRIAVEDAKALDLGFEVREVSP